MQTLTGRHSPDIRVQSVPGGSQHEAVDRRRRRARRTAMRRTPREKFSGLVASESGRDRDAGHAAAVAGGRPGPDVSLVADCSTPWRRNVVRDGQTVS